MQRKCVTDNSFGRFLQSQERCQNALQVCAVVLRGSHSANNHKCETYIKIEQKLTFLQLECLLDIFLIQKLYS